MSQRQSYQQSSPTSSGANSSEVERRSVAVSALIFSVGTALSRILGLVRDVMTARYFNADIRDAFLNAFRLPNLFRRIFGEGSISVSFIPVFVDLLSGQVEPAWKDQAAVSQKQGNDIAQEKAKALVAGVFTILLSITVSISLLAILFMPEIMHLLLSGQAYLDVPGKFALTVYLAQIMFGFLILISMFGYFMAILNSLRRFAMTALAPCFFNIAMISAAKVSPHFAAPEVVLAYSVLLGGFLQMGVLVPELIRSGYFPKFSFAWHSPEIMKVLKAVLPSVLGVSILQLTALVNMRFAAELPSGSHSYLYLADRILELPLSLFVVSIGSALLPTLAKFHSENNRVAMSETINHYIRLIVFVAWPAGLGIFILADPITDVLFLGREFKYVDVVKTANVIRVYSFAVMIYAGVRILAQGFYAIRNTWFPALASLVALFSHVLFAFVLTKQFQLEGLAAASVCSSFVNLMMLTMAYNSWVGSLQVKLLAKSFGKFILCGIAMALSLQIYHPLREILLGRFMGARAVSLFVVISFALFVYLLCAHLLRVQEFHETWGTLRSKLSGHHLRFRKR